MVEIPWSPFTPLNAHTVLASKLHAENHISQGHVKPVVTTAEIHSCERTDDAYIAALNRVVHNRKIDLSMLLEY